MNSRLIFWRNFKHRKLRTLFTLLTIMISVALVLAVVSTVDTTKKAVPHFVEAENEQLDFRVLGKQDLFSVNMAKQIAEVAPTAQLLASIRYPAKMDLAPDSRVILTDTIIWTASCWITNCYPEICMEKVWFYPKQQPSYWRKM